MASNDNKKMETLSKPAESPLTESEKTPAVAVQPVASKPSVVPARPKAATKIPPGYEVIRVRKPDGQIARVMRPIQNQPTTAPARVPAEGSPDTSQRSQTSEKTTAAPSTSPTNQAANTTQTAQSLLKTNTEAATTATPATTAQSVSKREIASNGFRIMNRVQRLRNRGRMLAQAFDPYGDYGSMGPGDIELDEGDDDYNDDDEDDDEDTERSSDTIRNGQNPTPEYQGNGNSTLGNAPPQYRAAPGEPLRVGRQEKAQSQVNEKETNVSEKNVIDPKVLMSQTGRQLMPHTAHWMRWIVWIITVVTPVLFIVLGIFVSKLEGKKTGTMRANAIEQATKAAVTVWPILFAAVISQSLKAIATFRVERGIKAMTLEQLIGSHSVASAIKQPFLLQRPDLLTLGLTVLWALSPLANQAMQRWTFTEDTTESYTRSIFYLNTVQDNYGLQYVDQDTNTSGWNAVDGYLAPIDELFMASFLPPSTLTYYSDNWGNLLIPSYDENAHVLSDGWQDAHNNIPPSLLGVPTTLNITSGTTTFIMDASYLVMECLPFNISTMDKLYENGLFNFNENGTVDSYMVENNTISMWSSMFNTLLVGMTPFAQANRIWSRTFALMSANIYSNGSLPVDSQNTTEYSYTTCNLTQVFVTTNFSCNEFGCRPFQVRKLTDRDHTNFDLLAVDLAHASNVGGSDLSSTKQTLMERYLMDPSSVNNVDAFHCNLSTVDLPKFTERLSMLVNTFYSAGFAPDLLTGGLQANSSATTYGPDNTKQTISLTASTTATYSVDDYPSEIYRVQRKWISISIICSVILFLCGVTGVVLETRTLAPDILGFASSVARQSKNVRLPPGDAALSGAEKARQLADVRLMMQDVWPDRPVGKIALAPYRPDAQRLKEGRFYK